MIAPLALLTLTLAPQGPVTIHEDLQYSDAAPQPRRNRLDLYVPEVDAPPPVVMFVHGGSWTGGSKDLFGRVGELLAREGYACAVINTRLFPFAKPDAMVVDCAHALGFLHRRGGDYGYDGDRLFVMGHSSGAHLCSWLAFDERKLELARVPRQSLRGAVLLSGPYDVRARHFALDGVFGADAALRRRASTWLYVDGGECPTYVGWAQHELAGLPLCAQLLTDRLRSRGVAVQTATYADRNHANYIFQLGTARDAVTPSVLRFLRAPDAGARASQPVERAAMLWLAADERERHLGRRVASVCREAGVEVYQT
ncbi:MAG: alpha/beta hydrolase fold domain-containing protein [Planctomycetota bacterium]